MSEWTVKPVYGRVAKIETRGYPAIEEWGGVQARIEEVVTEMDAVLPPPRIFTLDQCLARISRSTLPHWRYELRVLSGERRIVASIRRCDRRCIVEVEGETVQVRKGGVASILWVLLEKRGVQGSDPAAFRPADDLAHCDLPIQERHREWSRESDFRYLAGEGAGR